MKPTRLELKAFGEEAAQRVRRMEAQLERLGGASGDGREAVDALFREVHSLKGAAGALGLDSLAMLAHATETALEPVRAGRLALDPGLSGVFSAAFQWMLAHSERAHLSRFLDVGREVATLEQSVAQAYARQERGR